MHPLSFSTVKGHLNVLGEKCNYLTVYSDVIEVLVHAFIFSYVIITSFFVISLSSNILVMFFLSTPCVFYSCILPFIMSLALSLWLILTASSSS